MIREVAWIDEARCIGCARCLPACPFDAILGANRYMHTVLAEACTGCELCVAPCPVDCIEMVPRSSIPDSPPAPTAPLNRKRLQARTARLQRQAQEKADLLALKKRAAHSPPTGQTPGTIA